MVGLGDGDETGDPAGLAVGLADDADGSVVGLGEPAASAGPKVQGGVFGAAHADASVATPRPPTSRPPRCSKARRLTGGPPGSVRIAFGCEGGVDPSADDYRGSCAWWTWQASVILMA